MKSQNKILYLVAPGMGKTTLSDNDPNFLDFDIGSVRKHFMGNKVAKNHKERWKLAKLWYPALFEAFSVSLKFYDHVLINEPSFARFVKVLIPKIRIVTLIPFSSEDWINRICSRSDSDDFCKLMKTYAIKDKWLESWIDYGKELGEIIVIPEGKFLSDVIKEVKR